MWHILLKDKVQGAVDIKVYDTQYFFIIRDCSNYLTQNTILFSLSTFEYTKHNQGFNCVCKHSETHKSSKLKRLCAAYVYTLHTVSTSQRQTALPHCTRYVSSHVQPIL